MEIKVMLRRYRKDWEELDHLLHFFAKRPQLIQAAQIRRLTYLYRKASSHLSLLQTRHPDDELTGYLNQLVVRTHHTLYKHQHHSGVQLAGFFGHYFIGLIRSRRWFILTAAVIVLCGGMAGFAAVLADSTTMYSLFPARMVDNLDPSRAGEGLKAIPHSIVSAEIMTNNIRVAVLAFASGITFGIWTVYLLAYNGVIIGALAAVYWQAGENYLFWAYILPHGVIELTAIFIAGGAGLYMGYRMWVPGQLPWKLQLLHSAKESLQLLLGTVPLFVIAGTIEGYITPSELSLAAKYAVAVITLGLLLAYYGFGVWKAKREKQDNPQSPVNSIPGSAAVNIR